jgi:hypothetical protein
MVYLYNTGTDLSVLQLHGNSCKQTQQRETATSVFMSLQSAHISMIINMTV